MRTVTLSISLVTAILIAVGLAAYFFILHGTAKTEHTKASVVLATARDRLAGTANALAGARQTHTATMANIGVTDLEVTSSELTLPEPEDGQCRPAYALIIGADIPTVAVQLPTPTDGHWLDLLISNVPATPCRVTINGAGLSIARDRGALVQLKAVGVGWVIR